ncbi:MAG: hypothetical protein EOP43_08105 [Sphingobacteriaceae bacterium]|nr:MAG: hypothetical protein EOP43_08105 [Sphingobacteriaceae bacterium]
MKTVVILMICIISFSGDLHAQDSAKIQKTNPIIYVEAGLGYAQTKIGYIEAQAAANYQFNKNLITARSTVIFSLNQDQSQEHAILFGRRYINGERSLSYSLGASWNRVDIYNYSSFNVTKRNEIYLGLPFEVAITWFNERKEKANVLGYFPFGKPFALGGGAGFKILGNLSSHSYIAIGFVIGFGFYKHY